MLSFAPVYAVYAVFCNLQNKLLINYIFHIDMKTHFFPTILTLTNTHKNY